MYTHMPTQHMWITFQTHLHCQYDLFIPAWIMLLFIVRNMNGELGCRIYRHKPRASGWTISIAYLWFYTFYEPLTNQTLLISSTMMLHALATFDIRIGEPPLAIGLDMYDWSEFGGYNLTFIKPKIHFISRFANKPSVSSPFNNPDEKIIVLIHVQWL